MHDLAGAIAELEHLYPPTICRELVMSGYGWMVFGLYLGTGWCDSVNELLQLGADLRVCQDWRTRSKQISDLRNPEAYGGARLEIGVEAGLRRVGIVPVVEPGSKDEPRPDLVAQVDGLVIAMELKSIGDPTFERNRRELLDEIGFLPEMDPSRGRGTIHLLLSDDALLLLQANTRAFRANVLPKLMSEVKSAIPRLRPATFVTLDTAGQLTWVPPSLFDPENMGLGVTVPVENPAGPFPRLRHALRRAKEASAKFTGLSADVRIVVVWGSLDHLPADVAAGEAARLIESQRFDWDQLSVDWIVFLNSHARKGGWTTEIAPCRLPAASHEIPERVLLGLTRWGILRPRGPTWDAPHR